ncbi:MAG: GH92 family glycosyl hydrolase [Bacteroidales bacterium]|nr:GH92 family glycosyl hydrolase [Bacteroidales bacterium]
MRLSAICLMALISASCGVKTLSDADPVDYVNTLTGTDSSYQLSAGNTYPATGMPWGLNYWTPQTGRNGDGWIYTYDACKIRGFKQTHQASPWLNDFCNYSIMPVTTGPIWEENARQSWFSHKSETAKPYYYGVYLAEHDVLTEIVPTRTAASIRLTYPEREMSYLVVDAYHGGSSLRVDQASGTIYGYNSYNSGGAAEGFASWFVIKSDTPIESVLLVSDGNELPGALEAEGEHCLALLGFHTVKGQQVSLLTASSFISEEQALQNLKEVEGKSFAQLEEDGRKAWNETLGRIRVEDEDTDKLRTFYSCLYRAVLFPMDLSEINASGKRLHRSPHDGEVHPGHFFTNTGFWDTFRCLFPLMNLVYPDVASKVQEGLVNDWLESGFLPEWATPGHRRCMVGNNSASVVADAFLSGIKGYDAEELWKAVVSDAHSVLESANSSGRLGHEAYDSLGYVPFDIGIKESAARTLEYAYDDWCIYQFGKALGKPEDEIRPYAEAAFNYRNLFDKEVGLMNGKSLDGSFRRPFNPLKWGGDFTEGNSLHYTWSVFHDVRGLISLMGGREAFNKTMDTVFTMPPLYDDSYYGRTIHEIREMQVMDMGNYAHGNQPVQHMLYLYDWSGQPWKTQKYVREVMDRFYSATPDGYCGDEDNGQTSAWYVFSAMGFYPVCPGSGQYAQGSPLFKKMEVRRPDGKSFCITAEDNSAENVYVQSLSVGGRPRSSNFVSFDELKKGVRLRFRMGPEPELKRGTAESDAPYSFSDCYSK